MRILVLADIHANRVALDAIDERFDACLFTGDLVDYGADPAPCVEWIRTHANAVVRGNHDHAVAQRIPARGGPGFRGLAAATRPLHWDVLTPAQLRFLARMPVTDVVDLAGTTFYMVHGTPRDPLDEYLGEDADAWNNRLEMVDADFVLVGHTHVPFHLDLDRLQVLNPGSVGQPRDGDARASYAIIENGQVEIRRVAYDVDAAVRQMRDAGVSEWAVDRAEMTLRNGGKLAQHTA